MQNICIFLTDVEIIVQNDSDTIVDANIHDATKSLVSSQHWSQSPNYSSLIAKN